MRAVDAKHYWIAARFERRERWDENAYPLNLPVVRNLDEPEVALSPNRQLSFLPRIHELVTHGSQFIIATHSPIILAYPDAWIYQTTPNGLERVEYEETEHFQVTRSFLNRREVFLETLLADDGPDGEDD